MEGRDGYKGIVSCRSAIGLRLNAARRRRGKLFFRNLIAPGLTVTRTHLVIRPLHWNTRFTCLVISGLRRCLTLAVGLGKTRFPWFADSGDRDGHYTGLNCFGPEAPK